MILTKKAFYSDDLGSLKLKFYNLWFQLKMTKNFIILYIFFCDYTDHIPLEVNFFWASPFRPHLHSLMNLYFKFIAF